MLKLGRFVPMKMDFAHLHEPSKYVTDEIFLLFTEWELLCDVIIIRLGILLQDLLSNVILLQIFVLTEQLIGPRVLIPPLISELYISGLLM